MLCIGIKMESGYLTGKMRFSYLTTDENLQDFTDSLILKNMELTYGVIPASAILQYVSQQVGKSRLDILSNFETFSKNIIQVYGEVEGKKFLSKLDVVSLKLL